MFVGFDELEVGPQQGRKEIHQSIVAQYRLWRAVQVFHTGTKIPLIHLVTQRQSLWQVWGGVAGDQECADHSGRATLQPPYQFVADQSAHAVTEHGDGKVEVRTDWIQDFLDQIGHGR